MKTNTNPTMIEITMFPINGIRLSKNSYNKIPGSAKNSAICCAKIGRLKVKIEPNKNIVIIIITNILESISFFTRIRFSLLIRSDSISIKSLSILAADI